MNKSIRKQISTRQIMNDFAVELDDKRKEAESVFSFLTYVTRKENPTATEIIATVGQTNYSLLREFKLV